MKEEKTLDAWRDKKVAAGCADNVSSK